MCATLTVQLWFFCCYKPITKKNPSRANDVNFAVFKNRKKKYPVIKHTTLLWDGQIYKYRDESVKHYVGLLKRFNRTFRAYRCSLWGSRQWYFLYITKTNKLYYPWRHVVSMILQTDNKPGDESNTDPSGCTARGVMATPTKLPGRLGFRPEPKPLLSGFYFFPFFFFIFMVIRPSY